MSRGATTKARPNIGRRTPDRLGIDAWVEGARKVLVAGGVSAVKVDPLATALGVTTGSFYWHFKDRKALLASVLEHWELTNSAGLFAAVARTPNDPHQQLSDLVDVWIDEGDYCPAYDAAVRDWARTSPEAERAVRRVDEKRINLLQGIFTQLGYDEPRAFIRARVAYFHQVGYYALHIIETRKQRHDLKALYLEVLGAGVGLPTPQPA